MPLDFYEAWDLADKEASSSGNASSDAAAVPAQCEALYEAWDLAEHEASSKEKADADAAAASAQCDDQIAAAPKVAQEKQQGKPATKRKRRLRKKGVKKAKKPVEIPMPGLQESDTEQSQIDEQRWKTRASKARYHSAWKAVKEEPADEVGAQQPAHELQLQSKDQPIMAEAVPPFPAAEAETGPLAQRLTEQLVSALLQHPSPPPVAPPPPKAAEGSKPPWRRAPKPKAMAPPAARSKFMCGPPMTLMAAPARMVEPGLPAPQPPPPPKTTTPPPRVKGPAGVEYEGRFYVTCMVWTPEYFPKALRRVLPENPLNTDTSTLTLRHT
ncbi:unnamed protein product [Durusdinium trenchii]|uniref:Uncharacterized protein n=1 Tax=Durusdinium trenchii TaxID=1381693 RepID=A0ABP0J2R5_9DINO